VQLPALQQAADEFGGIGQQGFKIGRQRGVDRRFHRAVVVLLCFLLQNASDTDAAPVRNQASRTDSNAFALAASGA
jgi:hypothetical protein